MPVRVKYIGQFGNCIFQYVRARLFAESFGDLVLSPFPYQDILPVFGKKHPNIIIQIISSVFFRRVYFNDAQSTPDAEGSRWRLYVFSGYFQDTRIYNSNVLRIQKMFNLSQQDKINETDVVIHCRLGDFYHDNYNAVVHNNLSEIIHPDWYLSILNTLNYDTLYLVVYTHGTPEKYTAQYLSYFSQLQPVIYRNQSAAEDFNFIRSFKRVVCSNSTFCWWAVFLGAAIEAYTPLNFGEFGVNGVRKSHGNHIRELSDIRGISISTPCEFCDIRKI